MSSPNSLRAWGRKLSGERTSLNLRHYRYWEAVLAQAGDLLKADAHGVRELERITHVLERAQKGQRLARGLSLNGETEEQIHAEAQAESRALIDVFIDAVKVEVSDEETRDRIRMAVLARLPGVSDSDEEGP